MVPISAIYTLFSATTKNYDLIFIYLPGISDFNQSSSAQDVIVEGRLAGEMCRDGTE